MRRRSMVAAAAALVCLAVGLPAGASASIRPCAGESGLVWENASDDGSVAELFTMGCDGVVHQLTHAAPGQGGSELPRWGRHDSVYFDSDQAGSVHLFRMTAVAGAPAQQLTVTDGAEFSAAPTPDGRRVVFEHAPADSSPDGLFVAPDKPGQGEAAFRRLTSNPNAADGGCGVY